MLYFERLFAVSVRFECHESQQDRSPLPQDAIRSSCQESNSRAPDREGLISRDQLYDRVWAEPTTKVAERYGVTDVAVAKWCKKLNVPRPGRGYWARKNAGYRVMRTPTKEDTDSDENGHFGVRGRERTRVDEVSALSGHGTRIGASFRYSW